MQQCDNSAYMRALNGLLRDQLITAILYLILRRQLPFT